jgi:hypothetical protein
MGVLQHLAHLLDDLVRVGELASGQLRVNLATVDGYFEDAAAGWYQFERRDFLFQLEQLVRQTDGLWLIVSHAAIFNHDLHRRKLQRLQKQNNPINSIGLACEMEPKTRIIARPSGRQ